MNENLQELLGSTASNLIFIMALVLFFTINKGLVQMNEVIEGAQITEKTLYQSQEASDEAYVTGAQIIFSIKKGLESDIEIDHATVLKNVDPSTYDYAWIEADRSYLVIKAIDVLGHINKVIYNKI